MAKRIHYPRTIKQQRQRLFELWEQTGNISEACRQAHVGRGTFYYWKPRFDEAGSEGLAEFASHAPDKPARIAAEVERSIIELKQAHPEWGKKRIAQELAKSNSSVPVVSPNTVKRVLKEAGLWARIEEAVKKSNDGHQSNRSTTRAKPQCGPVFCPGRSRCQREDTGSEWLIRAVGGGTNQGRNRESMAWPGLCRRAIELRRSHAEICGCF